MTKSLTAAELVKLACEAAREYYAWGEDLGARRGFLCVNTDGYSYYAWEREPHNCMTADLTPEHMASEEALTRALLASAVTAAETGDGLWLAEIGAQEQYGEERAEAISRLLDALLLEAPQ